MSLYPKSDEIGDASLLPGERLEASANDVTFVCPHHGPISGILYVTTYKLTFITTEIEPLRKYNAPVGFITSVEKVGGVSSKGEHAYGLEIQLKEFHVFRLAFKQEGHSRREFYETLVQVAFPLSSGRDWFAETYCTSLRAEEEVDNGWDFFDMRKELERIGVPSKEWRITELNENYQFCATYSSVIAVPASVTDAQVEAVGSFRCRSRIPALSWLHPEHKSSLTRGAQPLVGQFGKRCKEDEAFLAAISCASPRSERLVVMDARPRLNAMANKAMGGGYEGDEDYPNMEFMFLDIPNIIAMRDSLKKLRDMCLATGNDGRWLSQLDSSHWLDHIRLLLASSLRIVDLLDRCQVSVFVHCSDGWDRTAQLCALAMLMMDPYYRTLSGFAILIEKEWLSFGHKFQARAGHGDRNSGEERRAPIFLQFMDVVWQMTLQFPSAFEFNEEYLLSILHHLHSCLFGTFLHNSEKERRSLYSSTISLWGVLTTEREKYSNCNYSSYNHSGTLYPTASIRRLQFWSRYYKRWHPSIQERAEHAHSSSAASVTLLGACSAIEKKCAELQRASDEKQPDV